MWETTPRKVLCAIETAECRAALEYAGGEAARRRTGVHLVHVEPTAYGGSPAQGETQWIGDRILGAATRSLEHLLAGAGLLVTSELARGPVGETLVAASAHSCLVVLQHRGTGHADGPPILSVHEVVAGALAPVVAVPADWRTPGSTDPPVVTVGVVDRAHSARVVSEALQLAELAEARLRLVHAIDPHPSAGRPDLMAEFGDVLAEHPGVSVEPVVVQGSVTPALLRQARDSRLLVVGRHRRRAPATLLADRFDHTLLRLSPVPVMVVDPLGAPSLSK
jgi:nucleotide-binding universal stress UspA family protein